MRRTFFFAVFLAALGMPARGQAVPTFTGPAGQYTVLAPAPVTVEYGKDFVTIRWGVSPAPKPDPKPDPVPDPIPPTPPPAPKTTGPVFVSLILQAIPTVEQAVVKEQLAATDWKAINAGFRAYDERQGELTALGLDGKVKLPDGSEVEIKAPCVVIQAKPATGDRWPIVRVIPHPFAAPDVSRAIEDLRK